MSKTLIVMRHAKSSWKHDLDDHDRPLNARGRAGASALGDWLRNVSALPDEILCSSAARTQETAQRLNLGTAISTIPALYLCSADEMLREIRRASGQVVLVVAHNPGIADFAERLGHSAPDHPRFLDYPSGATTVFSCGIDSWADLKFASATPIAFTIPRDLV